MTGEEWLEFYRYLFEFVLKHMADDELETDLNYVAREIVEARLQKKDKEIKGSLAAWYKVLCEEKERRVQLAKQRAPRYKGEDRIEDLGHVIAYLKQYYTGDLFLRLFEEVTGFQTLPIGNYHRMKYRCTLHGDDKNPSGMLYLDEGRYHCFACNIGGDIFKLLLVFPPQRSFIEAVKWLAGRTPEYVQIKEGKWKRV
jgi:hypothetical protein